MNTDHPEFWESHRTKIAYPCQRSSGSQDDRIDPDKTYLARIHGRWYLGGFHLKWYGWSFDGWDNPSYQLDSIEDLYEIDLGALP